MLVVELGLAVEDSFHVEDVVAALVLVFAAVDVDAVVSVPVLEDRVALLQPARANPAKIKVNNMVFFIGGLSCAPTDRAAIDRFAPHRACATGTTTAASRSRKTERATRRSRRLLACPFFC